MVGTQQLQTGMMICQQKKLVSGLPLWLPLAIGLCLQKRRTEVRIYKRKQESKKVEGSFAFFFFLVVIVFFLFF